MRQQLNARELSTAMSDQRIVDGGKLITEFPRKMTKLLSAPTRIVRFTYLRLPDAPAPLHGNLDESCLGCS